MTARSRSYSHLTQISGTYKYWTGYTWQTKVLTANVGVTGDCNDVVGHPELDNLFDSLKTTRCYPSFTGTYYQGLVPVRIFDAYPIQVQDAPKNPEAPFPLPTVGQWQGIAQQAAASTNPSTAHVSIPTFLGELKDLPGMLKGIPDLVRGRGAAFAKKLAQLKKDAAATPKLAANIHLAYKFGWKPFVSDLMAMLGFADATQKRIAVLARLASGRSIKRRQVLPSQESYSDLGTLYTHTSGVTTKHHKEVFYRAESWVSVRWNVTPQGAADLPQTQEAMHRRARQLATGMTSYEAFATAWELLPWSWMADWFWNIGAWLKANNNSVPVHVTSVCWMRTSRAKGVFTLTDGPSLAGVVLSGDYRTEAVMKRRIPINPLLVTLPPLLPSLPALSNGQWAVLASIFSQRA